MKICRTLAFLMILAAFPVALQALVPPSPLSTLRKARKFGQVPGTLKKNVDKKELAATRATSAESTAFLGKLTALEAVFTRHGLVNKPIGYNSYVDTFLHPPVVKYTLGDKQPAPLSGWVKLTIKQFGEGQGQKMTETLVDPPNMIFYANYLEPLFESHRIFLQGPGDDLFYAPKGLGTYQGFSIYNDNENTFFVTSSKNALWIPVTQEEWIKNSILRVEASRDEQLKDIADKPVAPKEIVDEGRETRRRAFEEAYQLLKQHNPAEAEKARKEFEASEKKYTEEAAAHPVKNGEQVRELTRKKYGDLLASLKAQLNGLSATARKEPAVYVGESKENPAGLGTTKEPDARAVVRINYQYFRDGKPRHAIRCLTLRYSLFGTRRPDQFNIEKNPEQFGSAVLVELHKTFDWKAVLAVLDK
jgi:hypothetical protein